MRYLGLMARVASSFFDFELEGIVNLAQAAVAIDEVAVNLWKADADFAVEHSVEALVMPN